MSAERCATCDDLERLICVDPGFIAQHRETLAVHRRSGTCPRPTEAAPKRTAR